MLSPLQLKLHQFTEVSVEAIPSGLPDHASQVTTEISWGHSKENDQAWKVELKVEFGPDEERKRSPYRGTVAVVGFFEVEPSWPAELRRELVGASGPSMLYGAVREIVLILTARSSHGAFTLPTMHFAPPVPDEVVMDASSASRPAKKKGKKAKGRASRED